MRLTDNFREEEFKCNCEKCRNEMKIYVVYLLQAIRHDLDEAMYVTSGYRCEEYNKKIGGVENSFHMYGKAADITIKDKSKYPLLEKLALEYFEEVVYYHDKNFIHVANPR